MSTWQVSKKSELVQNPPNVALRKVEVTNRSYLRVILTSKNMKNYLKMQRQMYILHSYLSSSYIWQNIQMFFWFKRNKNVVNVTSANYRFKLHRAFIKPYFS